MFWSIISWLFLMLVLLLASLLGFLLLARMRVQVQFPEGSSDFGWCRLSWSPAAFVALDGAENDPVLHWRLLWWQSSWHIVRDPFPASWRERLTKRKKTQRKKEKDPKTSPSAEGRSKRKRVQANVTLERMQLLAIAAWHSLHVRRFYLDLDTGNWARNGQCYPMVAWASAQGWPVAINFRGETILIVDAWVRPVHLLWALAWTYGRPKPKSPSYPAAFRPLAAAFYHP